MAKRIRRWEDQEGRQRISILRGTHNVTRDGYTWPRQQAVTIWPEEHDDLENAFLEGRGLMTLTEHRRQIGLVYDEVERRDAMIRRLEAELKYASTGEEEEDDRGRIGA